MGRKILSLINIKVLTLIKEQISFPSNCSFYQILTVERNLVKSTMILMVSLIIILTNILDPTFDFKSEEFRLELQRNNVWASQLVNCFFLEREIFLLMMVDKTIVCDVNFKILRNIREDVMYSNLRCCTQAYRKHNDQAMFIQGFVYEREKSYRTIKVGGSPVKLTSRKLFFSIILFS